MDGRTDGAISRMDELAVGARVGGGGRSDYRRRSGSLPKNKF